MKFISPSVLVALLSCFFLAACNTVGSVNDNVARPTWIDNPGNGASASAGTHIRGTVAQEDLAIQRAAKSTQSASV